MKRHHSNSLKNLGLTVGVALGFAFSATAQTSVDSPTLEDDAFELSGFTVFGQQYEAVGAATRMPLTERQTPQTISLIDSSRLEAENLFTMDDVMRNVTGVSVSLYDTQRRLYFSRGFQITDVQVDGIPTYSNETNQEYDTALYERVEIVRGANGLLSGSGKPSGTINFHRKQPKKYFDASFTQSLGSWDYLRTQADISVPLTSEGKYRSRFVAAYTDRESFRERYQEDKLAFLASFAGDITENTTLTVGWQMQDNNPTASVWGTIPLFAADGTPADLPHTTNFATNWAKWQRESSTLFVNLEQKLGDNWQLKASYNHTTGDEVSKSVYADTWGGSGAPGLDKTDGSGIGLLGSYWDSKDTRDNIDIYVNGKYSAFGRSHDLIFGLSHSEYDMLSPSNDGGSTWTYEIPNIYDWDGNAPEFDFNYIDGDDFIITDETGFYASTRFQLSDRFSAIAGGRLTSWETDQNRYGAAATYDIDREFTPYIGFTYDLSENTTLYSSYTSIFEPQSELDVNQNFIGAVDGVNLELGIKSSFANGKALFTAAVFQTEQDNFAVRDFDYPSIPNTPDVYKAVDGTKTEGFELQLSGKATKDLSVIFGYTYNDTSRHDDDPIWTNLPEQLVQLSTHYVLPGELDRFAIGGGLTWQSELTGSSWNPVTQESFLLANFHANYRISDNFSATLSAKNAFDEIYFANLDYANFGEPRNILLSLKWKY
ncbi:TonB-dependent siderophore receptor [Pelagicoccus mobilis]|uniref:TonB-dependent siderophore receptor n=1 Tax=Pelagicoccus mobilis TaxID=415221 RepID=A0A934VQH3_9BACT|nr:TonB-dependent siderophore receptor [Pelagicoccus mobilis]MBK1878347.1 TonB-dependent siderophore receptor [Pelagicoccus mobilis]